MRLPIDRINSRDGFLIIFCLSLSLLFLVCQSEFTYGEVTSVSENRKNQIDKIETDLSREKEKYRKFGQKERDLLGQLSELEQQISGQRSLLKKIQSRIRENKKALGQRRKKRAKLAIDLNEVEGRLARRLVAFYKYAKRAYLQLLGSSRGLEQLRKRIKYLKVVMEEDQNLFRKMAGLQLQFQNEISVIKEQITTINDLEKAERERLQTIKKVADSKILLLMRIHKEKEFYETAVKELETAAVNLKNTVTDLESRETEKAIPLKALPVDFEKNKGNLPLPFNGRITRARGAPGMENTQSKGIYIKGPEGAEVRAIYPGRVEYSGWLKGYGQIIVINHGTRFFTVSAHLQERFKAEGDMVEKGSIIGLLGETGSIEGPRLYFEIRKGGGQLDAFKWLKVH